MTSSFPVQDSVVQERLIEKYMSLPNEIWDTIIQRASVVRTRTLNHSCCAYMSVHLFSGDLEFWIYCSMFFNYQGSSQKKIKEGWW